MAFPFQWSSRSALILVVGGSTANIDPRAALHSKRIPSPPAHWNTFRIVSRIQRLRDPVIVGSKSPEAEAAREFDEESRIP